MSDVIKDGFADLAEELAADLEETIESVLFDAIPGLTDLDDFEGPSRSVAGIVEDPAGLDDDFEGPSRSVAGIVEDPAGLDDDFEGPSRSVADIVEDDSVDFLAETLASDVAAISITGIPIGSVSSILTHDSEDPPHFRTRSHEPDHSTQGPDGPALRI